MKHCFIINPIAGRKDSSSVLEKSLKEIFKNRSDNYEIYITKMPNDATLEIKRRSAENESKETPEDITFYICGGDGTCFEAVNGIVGYPHSRMTIVPVGSCNDFLKNFKNDDFSQIEDLVDGEEKLIDVLKINDRYTLNVANIGFDAKVNYDCVRFRHKYKTVKQSYNHAIIRNLLRPLGDKVKVTLDSGVFFEGKALLMAFANGGFYGGGYNCAPKAIVDDELMEMVIVKKVGILTFSRLIKYYKNGQHLDTDRFLKIIKYKQIKKVEIEGQKTLCLCLDGETFHTNKIKIELIPKKIRFVFPKKRLLN